MRWAAAALVALALTLTGCSAPSSSDIGDGGVRATPPVSADEPFSAPVALRIPSLKLDSTKLTRKPFQPLGLTTSKAATKLQPEGSMETPSLSDPTRFGYYCPERVAGSDDPPENCGAPYPGQPGGAIISSHVNGNGRKGGLYSLAKVSGDTDKPEINVALGDVIEVDLAKGTTEVFHVSRLLTPDKSDFPESLVFTTTPNSQLSLITCGGELNPKTHSYEQQIIVIADWVSSRPRK